MKRPLAVIAGGLILGEVLALFNADLLWTAAGVMPAVAGIWFFSREKAGIQRKNGQIRPQKSRTVIFAVLLFCILMGFMRMKGEMRWEERIKSLELETKGELWVEGWVDEAVKEEETLTITLKNGRLCGKICGRSHENIGRVTVFMKEERAGNIKEQQMQQNQTVPVGQKVLILGTLKPHEPAGNPGEFDARTYYLGFHSCYKMFGTKLIEGDERKKGAEVKEAAGKIKAHCRRILEKALKEPDAGILKAVLLGDKSSMDAEIKALYQKNGIAHILAISGLHISLIGAGIYRGLRRMGIRYGPSAAAGGALLGFYLVMTGFSASSFRAVCMMCIFFLAEYLGRTYDMISASCLAAVLLLSGSPYLLLQSGFQLSFGAVCSIGILGPACKEILKPKTAIGEAVVLGTAIQIGTYPLVLYHFFEYPIYGIFLNLAVIPLMPIAVISGIMGILAGSLWLSAGRAVLYTAHYILKFYTIACEFTGSLSGSSLILGRPSMAQLAGYGILLFFLLWMEGWKAADERKKRGTFCLLLTALFFLLFPMPQKGLEITFLDVGQGDGILVECEGSIFLIDGGSSDRKDIWEYVMEPCLKEKGISHVDYMIVSHCDSDHMNGSSSLLERENEIPVKNLILPFLGREDEAQAGLVQKMKKRWKNGKIFVMKGGDRIQKGKLEITCLYPGEEDTAEDRNEQSLVFLARYGEVSVLFTGDTDLACERKMAERRENQELLRNVTILKAAHHGSDTSTGEELLDSFQGNLKAAVLSYGENNRYGHPGKETLERLKEHGAEIFSTAEHGALSFETDGKKEKWRGFRKSLPEQLRIWKP